MRHILGLLQRDVSSPKETADAQRKFFTATDYVARVDRRRETEADIDE
jgi:hypothetical protein